MLSDLVVAYLFFGGAGAGACFISSVAALLSPRDAVRSARFAPYYARAYCATYLCGCSCVLVGIACLAFDLGRFDAIFTMLSAPRWSFISFGALAVSTCFVLSIVLAFAWLALEQKGASRVHFAALVVLEVAMLAASFGVMAYTGCLLQSVGSVPLWTSPLVPVLFVASSASCGIALMVLCLYLTGLWSNFVKLVVRIEKLDALVIAVEIACLGIVLGVSLQSGGTSQTDAALHGSGMLLATGDLALSFWLGLVAVGLVVPLLVELLWLRGGFSPQLILSACVCVLVGGIMLRACLVAAGMHPEIATL